MIPDINSLIGLDIERPSPHSGPSQRWTSIDRGPGPEESPDIIHYSN